MRGSAFPWLLLSTVAHAALALTPRAPETMRRSAPAPDDVVELAIDVRASTREVPPPTEPPPPDARRAAPTRPSSPRGRAAGATPPPSARATSPSDAPARDVVAPTLPSLSPRAVAQAAIDAEPPVDAGVAQPMPNAAQRLDRAIKAGVRAHVDTIADPVLKPGPRGGYVYEGHGFDATIRPDGSVDMRDRYSTVHLPLVPYQTPTGEWRIGLLGGSFKVFEWLDRKFGKNDPFQSERRWFLERTRPLREKLELDHYGKASGLGASAPE
ncbi:MAG: hypothetical protein ABW252_22730 [Polyangiales bacterium]